MEVNAMSKYSSMVKYSQQHLSFFKKYISHVQITKEQELKKRIHLLECKNQHLKNENQLLRVQKERYRVLFAQASRPRPL